MEHSVSEPILAGNRGKVAKSADAQNPNAITCYNGWIHPQDSLLNKGSLYFRPEVSGLNENKLKDKDLLRKCRWQMNP